MGQLEDPEGKRFVLRNRSRAYQAMDLREQAQQDMYALVVGETPDPNDVVQLGDVLFDQGTYAKAAPLYRQVTDRDEFPMLKTWATYRLGLTLDRMGQTAEGQTLLSSVRELEVKAPDVEHSIQLAAGAVLEEFSLQPRTSGGK